MGFLGALFGKKKEENLIENIVSPISGEAVSITEVPDETFASKILGEGVGINPSETGYMVAPITGTLTQLFETGHAFTVDTKDGVSILVHFGLNTVELNGQGFEKIAKVGDKVTQGDPIVKYDLEFLKGNVKSVMTPVVVLDSDEYKEIVPFLGKVVAGETKIIEIKK